MLGRAHCTCICTVFGMDSLGGLRSVHECLCLYVHTILVRVQYSAWISCSMHVVYVSACACTVFGMDSRYGAPSQCTRVLELARVLVYLFVLLRVYIRLYRAWPARVYPGCVVA